MPTYDYDCLRCGPFTAMRPMAEFRAPCGCPTCGASASRASLSRPGLIGMAPVQGRRLTVDAPGAPASHPAGCGCCLRRQPLPTALSSKRDRVFSLSGPLVRNGL